MQISKIDPAAHESDAKEELVDKINTYIQEKIVFADSVLVTNAVAKVYNDDVILTYGFSSVVFNILLRASKVTICDAMSSHFQRIAKHSLIANANKFEGYLHTVCSMLPGL